MKERSARYTHRGYLGRTVATGVVVFGFAISVTETGKQHDVDVSRNFLRVLYLAQDNNPCSNGRGDSWLLWGVNNPKEAEKIGRLPQYRGHTRPILPDCILAYSQQILTSIARMG